MRKICLLFFAVALCLSTYGQYVDLGLSSGTKWKSSNETGGHDGFYTYEEAVSAFGDKLPTVEQFVELVDSCSWTWSGNGYKVTGPNGNSIFLPATGFIDGVGNMRGEGKGYGFYWSSTSCDDSEPVEEAWYLDFDSNRVTWYCDHTISAFPIRLVQD